MPSPFLLFLLFIVPSYAFICPSISLRADAINVLRLGTKNNNRADNRAEIPTSSQKLSSIKKQERKLLEQLAEVRSLKLTKLRERPQVREGYMEERKDV
jgi:hypothetical protein